VWPGAKSPQQNKMKKTRAPRKGPLQRNFEGYQIDNTQKEGPKSPETRRGSKERKKSQEKKNGLAKESLPAHIWLTQTAERRENA